MSIAKSGFALFEVLVAFVIMSVGMLGIITMLITTNKASVSSYLKQQAIQSAYNMLDTMRANRTAVEAGFYNISGSAPANPSSACDTTPCSAEAMAAYNQWYWLTFDVTRLPSSTGSVITQTSDKQTTVTITIQWDDTLAQKVLGRIAQAATTQSNLVQFKLSTIL